MNTHARFDENRLDQYWRDVSDRHGAASDNGLELICYAGMPQWFNQFMHHFQEKAMERLVEGESFDSSRLLDIGTGVGRWARWFAERGASVTGIDLEPERLARAHAFGGNIDYRLMPADALDFADASFDVVNCVTVLQHVPDAAKRAAIAEIGRVTTPAARVVLLELTDLVDDAPHVFPWAASTWKCAFREQGFLPARRLGNEYIPLLRVLKRASRIVSHGDARAPIDAVKSGRRTLRERATLAVLRGAIAASYPVENAMTRFAPASRARLTGWLFRREP